MLRARPARRTCARSSRVAGAARGLPLAASVLLGLLLAGCSPALNWREAGPPHVDILLSFPCRPQTVTQPVRLAGRQLSMSMTGCVASGMTFALAHVDVGQVADVEPALADLHRAALANLSARVLTARPAAVAHADRGLPDAVELDLAGNAPGGIKMREHLLLFSQGTQVFQATVLARRADYRRDAARTFAASVQLSAHGR